jgi:hypothetical protein
MMQLRMIRFALIMIWVAGLASAETQLGGGITWVQFPDDDARSGYSARLMWFHGNHVGVKVVFSRYDIGDFPEHRYTLIEGSVLYRFPLSKQVAPYAGAGLSSATISAIRDEISSADYSFTDPTINLVFGSQFPFGRIVPFVEYERLIYLGESDFFGLDRASVYSVGIVFSITQ